MCPSCCQQQRQSLQGLQMSCGEQLIFLNRECFLSSFREFAIRPVSDFSQRKLYIGLSSHIKCELHGLCQPQILLVMPTVQCYAAEKLQLPKKSKKTWLAPV